MMTNNDGIKVSQHEEKYTRILNAAYELFLSRGVDSVSIREIAEHAGVAKGTFYLYFKDKADIKEALIVSKSNEIFQAAVKASKKADVQGFEEQIIYIVNFAVDILAENEAVARLLTKDLGLGIFSERLGEIAEDDSNNIVSDLITAAAAEGIQFKNPRILLFMIIELASATCFTCITSGVPATLEEYKPYLADAIRALIRENTI